MRLTTLLMFGAGYVLGSKAGRERYAEIVTVAEKASKRLAEYSARDRADPGDLAVDKADRRSRRRRAAL
jgi:hypothetical protein